MSNLIFQIIIGAWHFQFTKEYRIRIAKNKHYAEFKDKVSFFQFEVY